VVVLCQCLTTDRAIARIERNVGYGGDGGDGEKSFVMQEWHDGCDPYARPIVQSPDSALWFHRNAALASSRLSATPPFGPCFGG
jgi:hypothetical protein